VTEETELAWAAGLFDGEGSVSVGSQINGRWFIHAYVAQSGIEKPFVLSRFIAAIQVGSIQGPYNKGRYKPIWQWMASGIKVVEKSFKGLDPYLSPDKREQFEHCIYLYKNRE
jgi:hypothetical protein